MSTLVQPALRAPRPRTVTPEADRAAREIREEHRWFLWLAPSFVSAAIFFGLAVGTGMVGFMGPAVVFGPIAMMFAVIYLCVSSDSNGAGWHAG